MDSCNFPRTVEEMLEAGWYEKILRKVKKYNLKDILNTPEELTQDIFCQIIAHDYLSRYDPEYRPFNVYIYVLVENFIKKRGNKENTNGGKKIVNALSIENATDGSELAPNTVYLDLLEIPDASESPDDKMYLDALVSATRSSLQEFKAHSTVAYNGESIARDPATVFEYLLEGRSVCEIAEILQVSKQYIYCLLHKIRNTEAMQEMYRNAKENNLLLSSKSSVGC